MQTYSCNIVFSSEQILNCLNIQQVEQWLSKLGHGHIMEHHIALKCCHKNVLINMEGWSSCVVEWGGWVKVVCIIYWGEGIVDRDSENPKIGYNKTKWKLPLKSKIMGDFNFSLYAYL